jgi:hypothetical protein
MDSSRLIKELEAGRQAKRSRTQSSWQPNDKAYNGEVPKYSKLTYNFFLPILSSFEDTLISKLSDSPNIAFGGGQAGETRLGRQMDALWRQQSELPDSDYTIADLVSKRHGARYGRAFLKTIGTKKPFSIEVMACDPYDMVVDPNGGGDLENHRFVIQDGIFRSKKQLLDGVADGLYDKKEVARLLAGPGDSKDAYKTESDSTTRWSSLNQAGYGYDSAGENLYRLAEHVTIEDGERLMCVWNPESGIILSQKPLKESYGCDLLPWTSWAPYFDSKVFWSKAPDDDVRGAAEAMRVTLMEMLVNVQKQNWGTKTYDPNRFTAADLMISAPNGLIPSKPGAADMPGGLSGGYQVIQTPSVTVAANVVEFLDRFVGQKSGVTPDAQGSSQEDKVGIYFGNIEQLADRMGLQSKWYRNCWRKVGTRFLYQAKRNLTGKTPVQVLGARGSETEVLLARNIDPTLGVTVTGGSAEAAVSEAKRKERGATLDSALTNPLFQSQLNPKAALSEKLKSSGFEEDEIRLMTNKEAGSEYRDQQLRAQESVEKLLEGERPPLYQGASVVFVQQILDSAKSFTDGDGPEHERLIAYANAHIPIAAKNSALDAVSKVRLSGFSAVSALDQPSPVQDAEAPEQPDPQEMMDSLITNRRP